MGNSNSRSNSIENLSYQNQVVIQKLQRQILENQLRMQRMQFNQYQNNTSNNNRTGYNGYTGYNGDTGYNGHT